MSEVAGTKQGRAQRILAEVREAVARWREFADEAQVEQLTAERMRAAHRLDLPAG